MQNDSVFLRNGLREVFDNLKTIYGVRGDVDYNIVRYFESDLFHQTCRNPKCIDDIPEVSFEDIKVLCEREKLFKDQCKSLISQFDEYCQKKQDTDDVVRELAGFFGICPGRVDWMETLFPHMVDLFVDSKQAGESLWNDVINHSKLVNLVTRSLCDFIRSKHRFEYDGREIVSIGYARNYYRGENAYYGRSFPSLFREEPIDEKNRDSYRFMRALKCTEFALFIEELDFVRKWPFGSIYHPAIAQHYGIPTTYMDVSSDINAALFFACCAWDGENKCWRPLFPAEYEKEDSRKIIAEKGGDSRYGILHIAPADISNMLYSSEKDYHCSIVYPIGIQPFMRCDYQSGYIVKGNPGYDMFSDIMFNEVKFKLSDDICNWIYEKMEHGKLIYPYEPIEGILDIISCINSTKVVSNRAFDVQMDCWKKTKEERDRYKKELREFGCEVDKDFEVATDEEKKDIEIKFWKGDYCKKLQSLNPTASITFCI